MSELAEIDFRAQPCIYRECEFWTNVILFTKSSKGVTIKDMFSVPCYSCKFMSKLNNYTARI